MKRPRKHVIEEESHRDLIYLIPSKWVTRKLTPDYGLDYMVEIFRKGKTTGNIFYLQLKGSDQRITNNTFKYSIKRKHLEYYKTIINPILLVLYSTKTKAFWAIWTNTLLDSLDTKESKNQKSFQINLGKEKQIDESFFSQLENQFTNDLSSKVNIQATTSDEISELYHKKLITWLNHYYPKDITFDLPYTPNSIEVIYESKGPRRIIALVKSRNQSIKIEISVSKESRFLFYPILTNTLPEELSEILIILASILKTRNIKSSAEILINALPSYKGSLLTPEIILDYGKGLIETKSIEHFNNLIISLLDANNPRAYQFLNGTILLFDSNRDFTQSYQKNIILGLNKIDIKSTKAALSYNLANSYRTTMRPFEAITYYQHARKLEPNYLLRTYWWYEMGGVLFTTNHFNFAENCYKKSIELDTSNHNLPLTFALVADCQFHQGKFKDAIENFNKYFDETDNELSEYRLKAFVSQNFILANLNSLKFNIENSSILTEQAVNERNPEKLTEAISIYPLNGLAWFNYGVFLKDNNRPKEAFTAFLTTACIQRWDIESWKNALLIAFNLKSHDKILVIYKAILEIHGEDFINYFSDHILDQEGMTIEEKTIIIDGFNKLKEIKLG